MQIMNSKREFGNGGMDFSVIECGYNKCQNKYYLLHPYPNGRNTTRVTPQLPASSPANLKETTSGRRFRME